MGKKSVCLLFICLMTMLLALPAAAGDNRFRVAVLPFDDGSIEKHWWGMRWDVGKGVADELVTELLNTGKFRLIEREKIEDILREQDFGRKGRVDSVTAAQIGKILGVQYLIMGRVTEFADNSKGATFFLPRNGLGLGVKSHTARVAIDARVVDATTAEIQYAVTGTGEKKQTNLGVAVNWNAIAFGSDEFKKTNLGIALRDAVSSVATQLCEKVYGVPAPTVKPGPISGLVADIFEKKVYLTVGAVDGVEPGMTLVIYHVIRTVKNPQTDEILDYITEPVAEVEVKEVKEKSAVAVLTKRLNRRYEITVNDLVKEKEPGRNDK